jgi:hypothetical protein
MKLRTGSFDSNDQSPTSFYAINPAPPPAYSNLDWSDVNKLELDFTVYKALPNIRKELKHEVRS